MFGSKNEEQKVKSPIETIVSSFTTNAKQINALLGFPTVLLLFSLILFSATMVPCTPGEAVTLLGVGAIICLLGSVSTYLAQWFFALKSAQEKTEIMRDYIKLFLNKYLQSQDKVGEDQIKYAMDDIVLKLTKTDKDITNK